MAVERGYETQVNPGGAVGLPKAGAGSFGAQVGAAVEGLGDTLHRSEIRAYQVERQQVADSEAADFNARFAQLREDADKASIDARNAAGPGGAGHAEAMAKWLDDRAKTLTDGITEDRVRQSASAQVREFGSRFGAAEYQFEAGARVGKIVTDTQSASELAANRARRMHDPKAFGEELSLGRKGIEAMSGVPADVKQKLIDHHDQAVTVGFINGLTDTNPAIVGPLLDSGQFDAILSPEQMERARDGATIQIRREEAAQKAEAAQALVETREELATRRAAYEAGAGNPQDGDALAADYERIGDTSTAVTLRAKAGEQRATLAYRGSTLPEMDARISALTAKQPKGLSTAEASELSGLSALRSQTQTRLNAPGGALAQYLFATGKAMPPLDPGNPTALQARARTASAAAARYGRLTVEPLTDVDLPAFKDLMSNGPGGKLAALDALRGFGDARAIVGAARQMSGEGDGDFRIAARLVLNPGGREVARDVLRGDDALKANPAMWNEKTARADFARYYGPVLRTLPQDYQADLFEAAKSYYAARSAGQSKFDAGNFASAIENVMGRNRDAGGSVRGGVARTPQGLVMVPATMTGEGLLRTFTRSTPEQYREAAGGRVPKMPDGKPIGVGQFRALLPTQLPDGRYGFRFPSGRLITDDRGDPYAVDVGRLGR